MLVCTIVNLGYLNQSFFSAFPHLIGGWREEDLRFGKLAFRYAARFVYNQSTVPSLMLNLELIFAIGTIHRPEQNHSSYTYWPIEKSIVDRGECTMAVSNRSTFIALLDRIVGWYVGLSPETNSYTTKCVKVPVGDGLVLEADLYQPVSQPIGGTILVRDPYGRSLVISLTMVNVFASRGYQVLFVSCRGSGGSTGQFDGGRSEKSDGQAVVSWMRAQPWYTGSFATLGGSYLAFTQWALLADPPPDMVAAIITTGPHDYSKQYWGTGAFHEFHLTWSHSVTAIQTYGIVRLMLNPWNRTTLTVHDSLPLSGAVEEQLGKSAPWIHWDISHPNLSDPGWKGLQCGEALERANMPILLITGYYDIFYPQTLEQYEKLLARGCNVGLTVGPWTHPEVSPAATTEGFQWLQEHLAGRKDNCRPSPVRIFDTGSKQWLNLSSWPPETRQLALFLGAGKTLHKERQIGSNQLDLQSSFLFNPASPTPTIGGLLIWRGGSVDDSALATRPDVLTFTTAVLEEDIRVAGKPVVKLSHSSDNPYVDLFVRISEVDSANKRSHNLTEAYVRLDPKRPSSYTIVLPLHDVAHTFRKGVRIRLYVAGGSHPLFIRNLGTSDNPATGKELRQATHTIWHSHSKISRLLLPVVS